MSKLVPETMIEIKQRMNTLSKNGKSINEDDLIKTSIKKLMQNYLEAAEEGHYDDAKMNQDGNKIDAYDVNDQLIASLEAKRNNFVDDFKHDSFQLTMRLEKFAEQVAMK